MCYLYILEFNSIFLPLYFILSYLYIYIAVWSLNFYQVLFFSFSSFNSIRFGFNNIYMYSLQNQYITFFKHLNMSLNKYIYREIKEQKRKRNENEIETIKRDYRFDWELHLYKAIYFESMTCLKIDSWKNQYIFVFVVYLFYFLWLLLLKLLNNKQQTINQNNFWKIFQYHIM